MLTEAQVQSARPQAKPYKLADWGGLYLYVSPLGGRSWRYDYILRGVKETLTIGQFPDFSLTDARERHAEARRLVARGESPAKAKQVEKRAAKEATKRAREARARERARSREEARERIPATPIAAFSEKKITELTASEGVFLANALAGVFADAFADRVISRWFERSGAGARAPENEEHPRGG
jgi:Arm domain-containing DNA-binding protein